MAYAYLGLAILAEVIATSLLKYTAEFTKLMPSVVVVVCYCVSFYCVTLTLRSLPVGMTYAIWAGLGIFLVTLIETVITRQIPTLTALIGMGFIILGVVLVHLSQKS